MVYIYICKGILLSHRKQWNLDVCDSMDRPGGYYAKWNNLDGEGQMMYDSTYMWNLKNKTNKQT